MALRLHCLIGWILVTVTLAMVAFYVPRYDPILGNSYLIFFWHFPSAINCMNFFLAAGVFCGLFLFFGRRSSMDRWATSCVEVGMLACTVTLVTGGVWARCAWGQWNVWMFNDPRLLSVYIMWFTYAAYLAFRTSIQEPRKRRVFSSAFGIIAMINVPIVYFAIRIFGKENHPMSLNLEADSSLPVTRWFGAVAFLVLYTALVRLRRRVHTSREELERTQGDFGRVGI